MHASIEILTFSQIYGQGLVVQDSPYQFLPPGTEKSLHGTSRYAHSLTRLRLIEPLQITPAHGLEFVQPDRRD
jgi:hypothetical protein